MHLADAFIQSDLQLHSGYTQKQSKPCKLISNILKTTYYYTSYLMVFYNFIAFNVLYVQ